MNFLQSKSGRAWTFGVLYFTEGAPIGFVWWAMPAFLRLRNLPIEQITTLTAFLVLPWTLKFLWAPAIDVLRNDRWTYKSWILLMQFLMGAALAPLLVIDPETQFETAALLLFLHAMAASTQDAAIDALAIATVPANERGRINGWMQIGMLTGRSILGGGSLMLIGWFGFHAIVASLAGLLWLSAGLLWIFVQEPIVESRRVSPATFLTSIKRLSFQRSSVLGLLFAIIGGCAFEGVGSVAGPFLVDLHFSGETVGMFFAAPVIIAMAAGAAFGGWWTDKKGTFSSLRMSLLGIAGLVLQLALGVLLDWGPEVEAVLLICLYAAIGLFTAGSYAMFMQLTDRRFGATQFSAFMGATNACEFWATAAMGRGVAHVGYGVSFVAAGLVSLFGLPILSMLQNTRDRSTE